MHPPRITIADLSARFGVSHRALRFYEQKGLLRPVRMGKHRHYDAKDIDRIAVILKLKSSAFRCWRSMGSCRSQATANLASQRSSARRSFIFYEPNSRICKRRSPS